MHEMKEMHPEKKINIIGPVALTKQIIRADGYKGA